MSALPGGGARNWKFKRLQLALLQRANGTWLPRHRHRQTSSPTVKNVFTESWLACLWLIRVGSPSTTVRFDDAQTEGCLLWLVFRFLYKQLLLFFDADPKAKESCIFESSADSHQLQLKPEFSLHLYANRCPEGAAKNLSFKYASLVFLFLCIWEVDCLYLYCRLCVEENFGDYFMYLLNSCTRFLHAAVRMISQWLMSDMLYI